MVTSHEHRSKARCNPNGKQSAGFVAMKRFPAPRAERGGRNCLKMNSALTPARTLAHGRCGKGQSVKHEAEQFELFYLPVQEKRQVVIWTQEALEAAIAEYGHLITVSLAAQLCEVSRERIYHLIEEARFTRIVAFGHVHVALRQVNQYTWAKLERQKRGSQSATAQALQMIANL